MYDKCRNYTNSTTINGSVLLFNLQRTNVQVQNYIVYYLLQALMCERAIFQIDREILLEKLLQLGYRKIAFFGKVYLGQLKFNSKFYAIKSIRKDILIDTH